MAQEQFGTDPRGPIHTITNVGEYRLSTNPQVFGGCIPVTFSRGHVAELNFTMTHRVGENCHCFQCGREAAR